MWFRFPLGCTEISIQQQTFHAEHEGVERDVEGKETVRQYFRAPDHFAPIILDLGGFNHVGQPAGAVDDLTPGNPDQAAAMDSLAAQLTSATERNITLQTALGEAANMIQALEKERDDLKAKLADALAPAEKSEPAKK